MSTASPDVDRVPRHVKRRVRGGHPSGGFLFGSVLGNCPAKKLILLLRGTPATTVRRPWSGAHRWHVAFPLVRTADGPGGWFRLSADEAPTARLVTVS